MQRMRAQQRRRREVGRVVDEHSTVDAWAAREVSASLALREAKAAYELAPLSSGNTEILDRQIDRVEPLYHYLSEILV